MNPRRGADKLLLELLRHFRSARLSSSYPKIADLGIIGDRRTAAVVTASGEIVWYCPGRFDAPSLLGGLLDPVAGSWRIDLPGARPQQRRYIDHSTVLETTLHHAKGALTVTDWLNLPREGVPKGALCRSLTAAPAELNLRLNPRPDYGRRIPVLRRATPNRVVIDDRFHLHASHPVMLNGAGMVVFVPKGERSWAALTDAAAATTIVNPGGLDRWREATVRGWRELAARADYRDGPWREQVHASLRALRLLAHEDTGAVAAAVTTSLPEVLGGKRNYDYRYSWLRDSGLVVRALIRFEPEGTEALRHLGFVAALKDTGYRELLDPVSAVGGERVPMQRRLGLAGYRASRPNFTGNRAAKQLQLGSIANFVLAAREIYERVQPRAHWQVVAAAADFLAANWHRKDSGIWEEARQEHFTASKAFAVCALEGTAKFADAPAQAERWRSAARDIRAFVERNCRTPEGGLAPIAGGDGADISAALFPVWGFDRPDDPAMEPTIRRLEQRYSPGNGLFHRHLESTEAMRREGAFLAGTFWIAHYWIVRGDREHGRRLIEAGLDHANDLGLFAEEIDTRSGAMLGNLPLGLIHASFLAAVADHDEAV